VCSCSSASAVAIDNKIEQAMVRDMFATCMLAALCAVVVYIRVASKYIVTRSIEREFVTLDFNIRKYS